MRTNLTPNELSDDDHMKLLELFDLIQKYDNTTDTMYKGILLEDIRRIKKELVKALPQFQNIECLVAGDRDADQAEFVVCADAASDAFRVDGTIETVCSMCGRSILLSPDSPQKPPKICFDCASALAERRDREDGQDSLGA
jgi:hypothetical protein